MSTMLESYLRELVGSSPCTEINFVQDNCASPKETMTALHYIDDDDEVSVPSSCPGLNRWDSSSSSLSLYSDSDRACYSGNAAAPTTTTSCSTIQSPGSVVQGLARNEVMAPQPCPVTEAKKSIPRPPRRQVSWEEGDEAADECAKRGDSDLDMSVSTASMSVSLSSHSARSLSDLDNSMGVANRNSETIRRLGGSPDVATNQPPRPPPRRTSSRLRKFMLRTLETNLDCFPASSALEDKSQESTDVSVTGLEREASRWRGSRGSPNGSPTRRGAMGGTRYGDQVFTGKIDGSAALTESQTNATGMNDFLDMKNQCLAAATADVAIKDPSVASMPSLERAEANPVARMFDFAPPQKPKRQVTAEFAFVQPCTVHKQQEQRQKSSSPQSLPEKSSSGDSLHDLIRYSRCSRMSKSTSV